MRPGVRQGRSVESRPMRVWGALWSLPLLFVAGCGGCGSCLSTESHTEVPTQLEDVKKLAHPPDVVAEWLRSEANLAARFLDARRDREKRSQRESTAGASEGPAKDTHSRRPR